MRRRHRFWWRGSERRLGGVKQRNLSPWRGSCLGTATIYAEGGNGEAMKDDGDEETVQAGKALSAEAGGGS